LKGWKKIFPGNLLLKQAGLAIFMTNILEFKLKLKRSDKESHFILIKRTIYQEERIIIDIYSPNISAPNLFSQTHLDLQAQIEHNNSGNFNTSLSLIWIGHPDQKSTEKLQK
jgi:hypothetical protein